MVNGAVSGEVDVGGGAVTPEGAGAIEDRGLHLRQPRPGICQLQCRKSRPADAGKVELRSGRPVAPVGHLVTPVRELRRRWPLRHHDQPRARLAVRPAGQTTGQMLGGEGAEGGIDEVDAGEGRRVDACLPQQLGALAALVGGAGRMARRRQGGQQRMAGLQLPVERFALQHPAVVVAGVAEGRLAAGRGEAADAGGIELALAAAGAAIGAPALRGIDGDQPGADHRPAPMGQLLHLGGGQLAGRGASPERHGVEALTGAAHVDADHGGSAHLRDSGGCPGSRHPQIKRSHAPGPPRAGTAVQDLHESDGRPRSTPARWTQKSPDVAERTQRRLHGPDHCDQTRRPADWCRSRWQHETENSSRLRLGMPFPLVLITELLPQQDKASLENFTLAET